MKRLLLIGLLVVTSVRFIQADVVGPIAIYFSQTDLVFLAQVTSVDGDKITFTVTEKLRGSPGTILHLKDAYDAQNAKATYPIKSEWLLASAPDWRTGVMKDIVGLGVEEYMGWYPTSVFRKGDKIFVKSKSWETNHEVSDILPDGTKGLTLDHVKQLLKDHPYKP